ncbi:hypothetical protein ACFO1B_56615 [Dactylosporangium siamense]|uniref:hypothetical protein n=1 Tax=Dactylosporangium siamense TaxID=685454 RepID=UPI001944B7DE|nr:hypothetical protein [Dactylosporangium siamense]
MRQRYQAHRLSEVSQRYADLGIALPPDLATRLGRLVAPFALDDLDRHGSAEGLVGAWLATRTNRRFESDDAAWLVLLRMFYERSNEYVTGLKEVLKTHRMTLTKTRVEIRLQLASRCFFLGRALDHRDKGSTAGTFLLDECVQVSREVLRFEDALHRPGGGGPDRRSTLRGQLANALTILARTATDGAALLMLEEAEEHAAAAERFGDRTEEHFAYRIEVGLRLFTITGDGTHLERARDLVAMVGNPSSKRLRATAADVVAQLGFMAVGAAGAVADRAAAIGWLTDGERRYTEALSTPGQESSGIADGYLLAKRAQVRNHRYRLGDEHGRRSSRLLDDALVDWLDERAEPHRHDPAVVGALLDRSRVRARRNDSAGARADLDLARQLQTAQASAESGAKLRVTELEDLVEVASAADDFEALYATAIDITQLPADDPIPTAALVRACKILAGKLPEESWRPLLSVALDRIEVDLAHPSLTPPAVRHVAGHAALLAWLLGRGPDDPYLLGRAVQLYRTSFAAHDADPPSVDALVNAGTCALQLGKLAQAGDEADAEEAASLFGEGLAWLSTGLERAQAGTAVRPDFDPVMTHSRLGELALRLYPFTWDANHLDTAVTHLTTARDLGHDAWQLTGLLGDAHYRRGVAQNDADDLRLAITLKDAVFDTGTGTGTGHRENRSLTAAAALRLSRLTADDRLVVAAAQRALQAARCDPAWPWPVLQLGDIAGDPTVLDHPELAGAEPTDLAALVAAGQRAWLLRRAAELAVHNREFTSSILGGQPRPGERGVRFMNDRHRLVEQALVLKRLGRADAHREHGDTVRFRDWLTTTGAPATWTLPEPLAVVDLVEGDSVYVMRRAQARLLGASVVDWRTGPGPDPRPRFREALRYLAAFQAWRAQSDDRFPRVCGPLEQDALRTQLAKVARNLGAAGDLRRLLAAACEPFAAAGTPAVAKKDPHPGNWLWTRDGRLVLIDIEATVALPLLREAATVIDDLPLLNADERGWHQRAELCNDYLDALEGFGVRAGDRADLMARYEAMVTLHTAKGLGRLRQDSPGISSFSLATAQLERDHYRALLDHLARAATRRETRELATHLLVQH